MEEDRDDRIQRRSRRRCRRSRQLLHDGFEVRPLVRDRERAKASLGEDFEYFAGSVTDPDAVEAAVAGTDAVHISLAVSDPAQLDTVEHQGTALVAQAAARHGLRRISYLTGSLVRVPYGPKIPEHAAKLAAEEAIASSGVPYTFLRPTYFTETLARHAQGPLLLLLGRQRKVLHPVCAVDFARQVARALRGDAAANREFFANGPQALTLRQALGTYRRIVTPRRAVVTVPLPLMSAVDRTFMGGKLAPSLQIMGLLSRLGEHGDPETSNQLLGAPTTTVEAWCRQQAAQHPDGRPGHARAS
ncbi:MAG: SDR family oxidoreductase [Acidimicrobiales bacterium]